MDLLLYFRYPSILRGFLVLLAAGAFFPLTGVFVLKLNLVTLRFALMHGTMLGAAIGLAAGADPVLVSVGINLALIATVASSGRSARLTSGMLTTFLMVLTVGLAVAVIYRFNVPAKDTLAILWGNLYAMTVRDSLITVGFGMASLSLLIVFFGRLRAVLFDREIAFSAGLNADALYNGVLVVVGFTVALAVKLVGALLLDALLLLPAIVSSLFARSARQLFIYASVVGLCSSILGFLLSLVLDIPVSSAVTVVTALVLAVAIMTRGGGR